MARHLSMPYMGSKQKLVDKIIPLILSRHKGVTDFYDLFGGGGSVSFYVLQRYPHLKTHYNELNTAIVELLRHIQNGGEIPTIFVPRAIFSQKINKNDWYAGFLQCCWTFGNNQRSYLYGDKIEEFKQKYHETVIDGIDNIKWLENYVNDHFSEKDGLSRKIQLFLDFNKYDTAYKRRVVLSRQLPMYNQLEHMTRIERLEQLRQLPLKELEITNSDYRDIIIGGGKSVVYCDPPYENTNEYKEGGFDSQAFYDWAISQSVPVYFSSYKISDKRFKLIKAINTRSNLDYRTRANAAYNFENVYWNGVQ